MAWLSHLLGRLRREWVEPLRLMSTNLSAPLPLRLRPLGAQARPPSGTHLPPRHPSQTPLPPALFPALLPPALFPALLPPALFPAPSRLVRA